MERTRKRPLPDGRLAPGLALTFGLIISAVALVLLFTQVNPLTGLLAALALDTYVLLYTPLKRRSHLALLVGAVPGAIPPLIGWTAVTGEIGPPGLVLFGVMVLWQISHFLAIAIYRKHEYAKAGICVLPVMRGDAPARTQAITATALLLPVSLLLVPLGVVSWVYLAVGLAIGLYLLARALQQLRAARGPRGARRFFLATLLYPPMLLLGLIADWVSR
jgi:protoheme IX farnesyltransferase